jgi:hypothetical protein
VVTWRLPTVLEFMGAGISLSAPYRFQLSKPALTMIEGAQEYARDLVALQWENIEAVAKKLEKHGKLRGDDPVFARIQRIDGKLAGWCVK